MALPFRIDPSIGKLYAFVLTGSVLVYGMAAVSPVSVDYLSFYFFFLAAGFCMACAAYMRWRGDRVLAPLLEIVAAGMLLVLPILVSTYLAMSLNMPLVDPQLVAMDEALGFDWLATVRWIDRSPTFSAILLQSYAAFEKQLLLVPVLLCLLKRADRAAAFIAGYGLLCFLSSIIAVWFPALGTYAHYGYEQADFENLNIHFGYHFLESFHAVRAGESFDLSLGSASGILTFPSVHAGIAFLIMWAMWGVRWMRYPFVALNAMMAFSAVTHANHYLIDIVAGLGVAAVTVIVIEMVFLGTRPAFWPSDPVRTATTA